MKKSSAWPCYWWWRCSCCPSSSTGAWSRNRRRTPPPRRRSPLPDSGYTLRILGSDGQVTEMDMNQYLWGVVAAEMPASFEEEALKAQAVAARTYALNKGPTSNHPDADLCTDYNCFARPGSPGRTPRATGGDRAVTYTNKITAAVAETGNQVILYEGQLIDAVFHSSSASATQDAVEVWGNSVPYLQAWTPPEGGECAQLPEPGHPLLPGVPGPLPGRPGRRRTCRGPLHLGGGHPVQRRGASTPSPSAGSPSPGPRPGRSSTCARRPFPCPYADGTFTFDVTGFGHGVGMSQYGADAMAVAGGTYTEILQHYYTGVTVEDCPENSCPSEGEYHTRAGGSRGGCPPALP